MAPLLLFGCNLKRLDVNATKTIETVTRNGSHARDGASYTKGFAGSTEGLAVSRDQGRRVFTLTANSFRAWDFWGQEALSIDRAEVAAGTLRWESNVGLQHRSDVFRVVA